MMYRFRLITLKEILKVINRAWILIKRTNRHLKSIEGILIIIALVFAYKTYLDTEDPDGDAYNTNSRK